MSPEESQIVARLNSRKLYPLVDDVGMRVRAVDLASGGVEVEFCTKDSHRNAFGSTHGGIVTVLLDNTCSIAGVASSRLTLGFPAIEIKVSFLLPVPIGPVLAYGKALRVGKTVSYLSGELRSLQGELLATASLTARSLKYDWQAGKPQ